MSVCWGRRTVALPRPGAQGRQALHVGLRRSVCAARRPDREEAAFALLARHGSVFAGRGRLRFSLPELSELGHFAGKPEETKDPRGPPMRPTPQQLQALASDDVDRLTLLPEDVVGGGRAFLLPLDRLHLFRADRLVRVHDRHCQGGPRKKRSRTVGSLAAISSKSRSGKCAGDRRPT